MRPFQKHKRDASAGWLSACIQAAAGALGSPAVSGSVAPPWRQLPERDDGSRNTKGRNRAPEMHEANSMLVVSLAGTASKEHR